MAVRETSKWYIPECNVTSNSLVNIYWYVLVCTGMYILVPAQYKMVQGGTRWYKVVQDRTRNGIWWYMEVHGSTRICKIIHIGTYWNVLILMVQSGYAFLLDSLL